MKNSFLNFAHRRQTLTLQSIRNSMQANCQANCQAIADCLWPQFAIWEPYVICTATSPKHSNTLKVTYTVHVVRGYPLGSQEYSTD
jgi:hypothetical protein